MLLYKKFILFVFIALISSACSTFNGKFEQTHQINLAPFSENVAIMANELEYGFDKIRSLHSKWYFDLDSQKMKRLINLEKLVTQEIHFIVDYSSHIVYLSESNKPMIEKTTELSRYVKQMYTRYQNSKTLVLTEEQKTTFIENIKKQDNFLSALQAAQPFINELARYATRLLDQLKKAEKDVAYFQYAKIDSENKHLKKLIQSLNRNEAELSNAIVLLNNYKSGSKSDFNKFKKSKILSAQSIIQSKKSLSKNQVGLLKKHLLNELTENTNYFKQVEPAYDRYIMAQQELLRLVTEHDAEIRKTRLVFITFASAHRKMSSGIVKPAEWFDIKEAPKLLLKLLPI
jgi:hypothetical protein